MVCLCIFFFFFASRRRHTRLQGDWSSDVCSSDLGDPRIGRPQLAGFLQRLARRLAPMRRGRRSEERRVGKECRSRGSPDHEKKKERRRKEGGKQEECEAGSAEQRWVREARECKAR